MGAARHSHRPHQRYRGTGIWPDRDIAADWRDIETPACLCRPSRGASGAYPRGKPGFSTFESGCGRETDCPLEEGVTSEPVSVRGSLVTGVKYRELHRFRRESAPIDSKMRLLSRPCEELPWTSEQGFSRARSGSRIEETSAIREIWRLWARPPRL